MTRRELFFNAAAWAARPADRIMSAIYVWTQDLQRRKISLTDGVEEILTSTRRAGFDRVELMDAFFAPGIAPRTLDHLAKNRLTLTSAYLGGVMHTREGVAKTLEAATLLAGQVKPLGAVALNHNPSPKPQKVLKTDDELAIQAEGLREMDKRLRSQGLRLWVHHHDPEMMENAREWRHILRNTGVEICLDADWIHRGGQDPVAMVRETGRRLANLHIRSTRNRVWLESVQPSDIDYPAIVAELRRTGAEPFLTVELARQPETETTRTLEENHRLSRQYVERTFNAGA